MNFLKALNISVFIIIMFLYYFFHLKTGKTSWKTATLLFVFLTVNILYILFNLF